MAQDADSDGVANWADVHPCDSSLTAESFHPARGTFGTIAFEDYWNVGLDADYNDVVVAYNYAFAHGPNGGVLRMRAVIDVIAAGGSIDLGLALQLPVPVVSVSSVTRAIGPGAAVPLTAWAGESQLTVTLSPDIRADLFGDPAAQILNSIAAEPVVNYSPLVVEIVFSSPVTLNGAASPYDLFIFRRDDVAHEIHRTEYCGTSRMDRTLFGRGVDSSNLSAPRCYTDDRNLPSALLIPTVADYPLEAVDIAALYPRIASWASSGGVVERDWYLSPVAASAFSNRLSPVFPGGIERIEPNTSCVLGTSCQTLRESGVTASGVYSIDPDGAGGIPATNVYCDMTTEGGGWTLAMNLDTSDGNVMWWHNPGWLNLTLFGASSPNLDGDYKGMPWVSMAGRDILLVVHQQGNYLGWKSFRNANPSRSMNTWMNSGSNLYITAGVRGSWLSPSLWSGEHLVRTSNEIWVNQADNFNGYCETNDYDRICSDTCKVGGNDGGGLGNCHDCLQAPYYRTVSEAQAGWYNWTSNSAPCYAGTPHNGLGMFGSDTAFPATGQNTNVANVAAWQRPNGYAYDYAIFVRTREPGIQARSCLDYYQRGARSDGMYAISPAGGAQIQVYCDMTRDGGGWTLVTRGNNNNSGNLLTNNAVGTLSSPSQATSAKLSRETIGQLLRLGDRMIRYGQTNYGYLYVGPIQDSWIDTGIGSYGYGTLVVPRVVSLNAARMGSAGTRFAWPANGQIAACSNASGTTAECGDGLHLGTWYSGSVQSIYPDGAYLNHSATLSGPRTVSYELWAR